MTLPQPLSLQHNTKPRVPLAPNSLISSSSSSVIHPLSPRHLSDVDLSISDSASETLSSQHSYLSDSDTYVNDLGGQCLRDTDWPEDRVSRVNAYRVYDSTDDEEDPVRRQARLCLDSADVGLYDQWAEIADDQLSLEDLQHQADQLTIAIDQLSMNPLPREPYHQRKQTPTSNNPHHDQPLVTSFESLQHDLPISPSHTQSHTQSHTTLETLPDHHLSDLPMNDFHLPPPPPLPPVPILPDNDPLDALPQPGHRRIQTLPDHDSLEIPTPPPLKRIETFTDRDASMPTPPPLPTPPSLTTPSSLGGVETLPDDDHDDDMDTLSVPTPPRHTRIETLPDLDFVVNANDDMTVLDRRRTSYNDDDDVMGIPEETNPQRIEILSDGDSGLCTKVAELSNRIADVTRGLADVQMVTAGLAASAEACLGKTNKTWSRAEVCRLRITLDHLARLALERAYKTRDEADRHG